MGSCRGGVGAACNGCAFSHGSERRTSSHASRDRAPQTLTPRDRAAFFFFLFLLLKFCLCKCPSPTAPAPQWPRWASAHNSPAPSPPPSSPHPPLPPPLLTLFSLLPHLRPCKSLREADSLRQPKSHRVALGACRRLLGGCRCLGLSPRE